MSRRYKVELKEITKSFGRSTVLSGISLALEEGRFLSIVGPSGSGKTTLLRIIAGFLAPDTGRVYIDGRDITGEPPRNRNIGMVFQHYALFPNLNVYENVAFGLRARRVSPEVVDREVRKMLALVHLEDKMYRSVRELSGGEQQRVALARALAIAPRVLLLDEPLSALDAKVRLELRYELKRIQENMGITTIYVTHDQEEALSISDFVAVLNRGHIEQFGRPEEVYSQPRTRFVAEFIGISNILEMEVVSAEKGWLRYEGKAIRGKPVPRGAARVTAVLRPEHISIERPGKNTNAQEENTLEGHILGQVFLGSSLRLAVAVGKGTLFVDVQNRGENRFVRGEAVTLTFSPEALHYLCDAEERRMDT